MNTLPTYAEQERKIHEAYFKDEIKPLHPQFCFCGTLCNNSEDWFLIPLQEHKNYGGYLGNDFVRMERELLSVIELNNNGWTHNRDDDDNYETALVLGMVAALEVLKQIHIERGEVIDEPVKFVKRELVNQ